MPLTFWSLTLVKIVFKNSFPTWQRTQFVSVVKTTWLMLLMYVSLESYETHTHICAVWENEKFYDVMAAGTYSYRCTLNTWRIFRVLHLLIKFLWVLKAMSDGSNASVFQTLTSSPSSGFLNLTPDVGQPCYMVLGLRNF